MSAPQVCGSCRLPLHVLADGTSACPSLTCTNATAAFVSALPYPTTPRDIVSSAAACGAPSAPFLPTDGRPEFLLDNSGFAAEPRVLLPPVRAAGSPMFTWWLEGVRSRLLSRLLRKRLLVGLLPGDTGACALASPADCPPTGGSSACVVVRARGTGPPLAEWRDPAQFPRPHKSPFATCLIEWPPLSCYDPPPPCRNATEGEHIGWMHLLVVWAPLEHARLYAGGTLPPAFVRVIRGAQYVRTELRHEVVLVADPPSGSGGGGADAWQLTGRLPSGRYAAVAEIPDVHLTAPDKLQSLKLTAPEGWHISDAGDCAPEVLYCALERSGEEVELARTPVVLVSWNTDAPAMQLWLRDDAPRKDAMLSTYFTETLRLLGTRVLVKIPPEYLKLGRKPPRVRVGKGRRARGDMAPCLVYRRAPHHTHHRNPCSRGLSPPLRR